MTDIILYRTPDGATEIELRAEGGSVWLTQAEIADLFQTTKQNVSTHLKNIFQDLELEENSVVKESLTTAADGKAYPTKFYRLEAILAIGYRVSSPRGVQFRQWATTALREYLVKGFVTRVGKTLLSKSTRYLRHQRRLQPRQRSGTNLFRHRAKQDAVRRHGPHGGGNYLRARRRGETQHGIDKLEGELCAKNRCRDGEKLSCVR
jgi:hypothetical protein